MTGQRYTCMMAAQHPISDDTALVRWLALDTIPDHHWAPLSQMLDADERARAARFHFPHDRDAYIAAHALTRATLSRHAPCEPANWRFVAGSHGKPEIDAGADEPPLRFNLSHTRGLVAVAVASRHPLGVDVEKLDPRRLGVDLALRTFAPAECDHLRRLPGDAQMSASYAFWTLKEAYIKAVGLGLSIPLEAFAFRLDGPSIEFTHRIADDPARWRFHQLQPTPDHILALAVRHDNPGVLRIDARATTAAEILDPSAAPGSG